MWPIGVLTGKVHLVGDIEFGYHSECFDACVDACFTDLKFFRLHGASCDNNICEPDRLYSRERKLSPKLGSVPIKRSPVVRVYRRAATAPANAPAAKRLFLATLELAALPVELAEAAEPDALEVPLAVPLAELPPDDDVPLELVLSDAAPKTPP